jgi:hypothetical protein
VGAPGVGTLERSLDTLGRVAPSVYCATRVGYGTAARATPFAQSSEQPSQSAQQRSEPAESSARRATGGRAPRTRATLACLARGRAIRARSTTGPARRVRRAGLASTGRVAAAGRAGRGARAAARAVPSVPVRNTGAVGTRGVVASVIARGKVALRGRSRSARHGEGQRDDSHPAGDGSSCARKRTPDQCRPHILAIIP